MGTRGEETAQRLESAMARLIATVERLDETTLQLMPGEGEWSAMQTLAHVAELVPFWCRRAQQVASGMFADRAYDRTPDEYARRGAAVIEHGHDGLAAMVVRLRSSASQGAASLRAIPDEGWTRSALNGSQKVNHTVSELVEERVLKHVEAHIQQAAHAAQQPRPA